MENSDLRKFVLGYTRYAMNVLEPTRRELESILERWQDPDYWAPHADSGSSLPSPIQRASVRVKRPESVLMKIYKKPDVYPEGPCNQSITKMPDCLGARLIVYFLSDLPLVDREIQKSGLFEISTVRPPHAYMGREIFEGLGLTMNMVTKPSGYSSIHYLVRLKESVLPNGERPWFEIQLRTITEDAWAEIEHVLGYKPDQRTSMPVKKQFQIISNLLSAIDEHFNLLKSQLTHFQHTSEYMPDDPLNAENLPSVLEEMGVRCAQHEVHGLLKILASGGIETIRDFLTVATPSNVKLIGEEYRRELGRNARGTEIVSALVAMQDMESASDRKAALADQLEIRKLWRYVRHGNGQTGK